MDDVPKTDKKMEEMRHRLQLAMDALSDSRDDELDDLKFAAASPDNQFQWPQDVLATRGAVQGQTINARPCLTINKLPEHIHQVTNEQRQNQPAGKVIPASDDADVEVAEVFDGMIRYIEYISDADVAYGTACDNQVTYGEGYARILTEYAEDGSYNNQDIRIVRIRNSFSVYMDPTIQDPCGMDAEWCFITKDLLKEEYEREYPNAAKVTALISQGTGDESFGPWMGQDTVRIAEYFYVVYTPTKLRLYPGDLVAYEGDERDRAAQMAGLPILKERPTKRRQIKWMKTNGLEVLEESDWLGKWIPVVRLIGNEFEIDGRLYISGLTRNAKDAQRMYNYWASQEAEMLALAPKAPFIGYAGQFEGYEEKWKTANTQNWPYLEVNGDVTDGAGAPLPLPQRSQPPMASSGLLQAKMGAADDIKSTTGQYNASLGQTSNERTGKAILAREHQAAVGTFHYVDNYARFVRCITRQIVDLIPKVMDTARVARIMGEDGSMDSVKINPAQQTALNKVTGRDGAIQKIYNPGVGKYDVRVVTGPSYVTKRQETQEMMGNLLQGNPELWKIAGDLFVKNMDWPGAQEISKRLARTIDPKLLEGDDTSPEMQAAQAQMQAMAQEMEKMHEMLKGVQHSFEQQQLNIDKFGALVKAYDAETKRIAATSAGMTDEQIHEIVMGTIHAAVSSGDLIGEIPDRSMMGEMPEGGEAPEQPMLPGGMQ